MNEIQKIIEEGGMRFKKAKEGPAEKRIRFSDYLRGTHKSASAKKKAEYKFKRATRRTQHRNDPKK